MSFNYPKDFAISWLVLRLGEVKFAFEVLPLSGSSGFRFATARTGAGANSSAVAFLSRATPGRLPSVIWGVPPEED